MSPQRKVLVYSNALLLALSRGEGTVGNLPGDAEIVAMQPGDAGLGVLVISRTYDPVPHGMQLPVITAVLKRTTRACEPEIRTIG